MLILFYVHYNNKIKLQLTNAFRFLLAHSGLLI